MTFNVFVTVDEKLFRKVVSLKCVFEESSKILKRQVRIIRARWLSLRHGQATWLTPDTRYQTSRRSRVSGKSS